MYFIYKISPEYKTVDMKTLRPHPIPLVANHYLIQVLHKSVTRTL